MNKNHKMQKHQQNQKREKKIQNLYKYIHIYLLLNKCVTY